MPEPLTDIALLLALIVLLSAVDVPSPILILFTGSMEVLPQVDRLRERLIDIDSDRMSIASDTAVWIVNEVSVLFRLLVLASRRTRLGRVDAIGSLRTGDRSAASTLARVRLLLLTMPILIAWGVSRMLSDTSRIDFQTR